MSERRRIYHIDWGGKLHITKNSRSFWHEKIAKTHSFAKRGRARAQERRELETLEEMVY